MKKHTVLNTVSALYEMLTPSEKRQALYLMLFMFFCSIFEFVSVGSLFPYIKIISDPSIIHTNRKLNALYNYLNFSSSMHFIIFVGVGIFFLILIKAGIGLINNYYQVRFSADIKTRMSITMFKNYMFNSFEAINNSNTSFTSKHILYDTTNVFVVVNSVLRMFTNSFLTLALVVLMFLVSSMTILVTLAIMGFIMFASVKATRHKSQLLGEKNEKVMRHLYRSVDESLKGIRDIKVFKKENYFIKLFSDLQKTSQDQVVSINVMSNIPSVIVNTMGFAIILGVVLFLLIIKGNIVTLLPTLGIIAISIQRLLPGVILITTCFSSVRVNMAIIFKLHNLLHKSHNESNLITIESKRPFSFRDDIRFENICFSYKNGIDVLKDINIRLRKNSFVGIVGKSGSGKSTLINLLLGNYQAQKGAIYVDEMRLERGLLDSYNCNIAYITQKPYIFDASIKQNIAFGIEDNEIDEEKMDIAVRVSQLVDMVNALPKGLDEPIGEDAVKISGGQRQRIGLARAIYSNADLLIFDESTSALDLETEIKFFREMIAWSKHQKTILVVSHRKTVLDYCDEVVMLASNLSESVSVEKAKTILVDAIVG